MTGAWGRILEKYGQKVTVFKEGTEQGTACRAFLQPALERRGEGYVAWGEKKFDLRAAQPVYLGEELAYWWGLLVVRDADG